MPTEEEDKEANNNTYACISFHLINYLYDTTNLQYN